MHSNLWKERRWPRLPCRGRSQPGRPMRRPSTSLIAKLKSQDEKVRTQAWLGAGRVGAAAVKPLAETMADAHREVALAAKRALAQIVHDAGRPGGRRQAGPSCAKLPLLLGDDHPVAVRREVLWLISEIGGDESVNAVAALFDQRRSPRGRPLRAPADSGGQVVGRIACGPGVPAGRFPARGGRIAPRPGLPVSGISGPEAPSHQADQHETGGPVRPSTDKRVGWVEIVGWVETAASPTISLGRNSRKPISPGKRGDRRVFAPPGAIENSPAIHRWVADTQSCRASRRDARRPVSGPVSGVPPGRACFRGVRLPSDKSLGYYQTSLRDAHVFLGRPATQR